MSSHRGRLVFDHLQRTGSREVLELGTAHGVSAAFMAAAVRPHGGHVTTVDHVVATKLRDPEPDHVLRNAGVADAVQRVLVEDSSYDWWLGQQIAERSSSGVCQPKYDFVYIDGAHNWTIDGFAFFLVEKLLVPGGWILFDDLEWSYAGLTSTFGPGQGPEALGLSNAERAVPHMRLVFELLVHQHPSFSNLLIQDDDWGWTQKVPDGDRSIKRMTTTSLAGRVRSGARAAIERRFQ